MHHSNRRLSGPPTNQDAITVSLRRSQPSKTSLVPLTSNPPLYPFPSDPSEA